MSRYDTIVIGGGLVGSAVAYGLARRGLKAALLDEGDVAFRASRGNFGLVWAQSKGIGVPEYQRWSRLSSELWDDFAVELRQETGIDCAHEHRGGVTICLTEQDFAQRRQTMERLRLESGESRFEYQMLDHAELRKLMPEIGPDVAGASYTRYDGAANPLYLLRAARGAHQARRPLFRTQQSRDAQGRAARFHRHRRRRHVQRTQARARGGAGQQRAGRASRPQHAGAAGARAKSGAS